MSRRKLSMIGCICMVAVLLCACTSKGNTSTENGDIDSIATELPLPNVPKNITNPSDRAEYILQHFWEKMNFSDTLRSHDEKFMEQNFVNFISLFPHTDIEALASPISKLLQNAKADKQAFDIITNLIEKYLADAGSPMRNEDYYIIFLDELLATPNLTEEQLLRPRMQMERVMKNRPGTIATDFYVTTRESKRVTLHDINADLFLLIFYDPDCGHCTEILEGLAQSELLNSLISEKILSVLAVYTEGNRSLWNETKATMPQQWTVAIDESKIVDKALYDLPAMPTLYLLDSDKIVLLKDPTPTMLESYLLQILSQTIEIE